MHPYASALEMIIERAVYTKTATNERRGEFDDDPFSPSKA
jgi:hypothetical protein